MTEGTFWSSYTCAVKLLKDLVFIKENNSHKRIPYSTSCTDFSRGGDYKDLYQNLVDNRDYDILLKDDSIMQMSFHNGESRLMFIQNPQEFITFEDFLNSIDIDVHESQMEVAHELYDDDYQQALECMNLNSGATYMRYDVDSRGREHKENIHAYTHLHIGLNNNIRIPVGKYMTPLSFTVFVIRQVYLELWAEGLRKQIIDINHKHLCEDLPPELWTEEERKDFYLG